MFFFITGIYTDQAAKFISLDPASGKCRFLPIPLTGSYLLDDFGNWEGTDSFQAAYARYRIEFKSFKANSLDTYSNFMDRVEQEVITLGSQSMTNDVSLNLALWSNYALKLPVDDTVQYFRLSGIVSSIFNRNYKFGALGSVSGDCDVKSEVKFDAATSSFTMKYSFNDFNSSSSCSGAMNPTFLGYSPQMDGDDFTVRFDMRTIMAAYALNRGMASLDFYIQVLDSEFDNKVVTHQGDSYSFFLGIDPDYLGMSPVFCLVPISRTLRPSYNFNQLCLVKIVDTFVYPHLNHFGVSGTNNYNPYTPKPCDCANEGSTNSYCNNFDLLTGFVAFDEDDPDDLFSRFLDLVYNSGPGDINDLVYYASFASARIGGLAGSYPPEIPTTVTSGDAASAKAMLSNSTWRQSIYSFCSGKCTILTIRAFDVHDMVINPDYFQLAASSCSNDIYVSSDAFGVGRQRPPDLLDQLYVECVNFTITSVIQSFGIAMGTAGPISALIVMALVFIIGKGVQFLHRFTEKVDEGKKSDAKATAVFQQFSSHDMMDTSTNLDSRNSFVGSTTVDHPRSSFMHVFSPDVKNKIVLKNLDDFM